MEHTKFLYKIDTVSLKRKSDLKGIYITKPRLVALYDLNYDNVEPAKTIKYFKSPSSLAYPLNLNKGYTTYIGRKKSKNLDALSHTLEYAMSPKAQSNTNNIDKTKVFARRGTFVELMSQYFAKRFEVCVIRVSRFNEDLYMVHVEEEEPPRNIQPKETHHEQLLRFLFTDSPNKEPDSNEPIDENKRQVGVHKSIFGEFELIYCGEMQGIRSDEEIEIDDDLETLNACRFVMAKQMWSSVKRNHSKHFRYWVQAYLANITEIYLAYKDRDGVVRQPIVQKLTSKYIKEFNFKPGIYTEFLYDFLQRTNELLTDDNINSLSTVYEIYFNPETKVFTYKVFKDDTEKVFITQEYMEYCEQL